MDDVSNPLHRDFRRGIELEDAVGLLGPVVVVPREVRDEAARFAQPLGVGETVVRLPELRLGPLSVFDVDNHAVPIERCDLPCHGKALQRTESIDTHRPRAGVGSILVRRSCRDRMQPPSYGRVPVVGMDEFKPPPTGQALRGVAEILDSPLIQVVQLAFRSTAPHECRDGLDQETELTLARRESLFGALALVDIREQNVPTGTCPLVS